MLPAVGRRSGACVAKTFTASASRPSGRGNHAAADHFCGRHRLSTITSRTAGRDPTRARNRAQHSPRARLRDAADDRRAAGAVADQRAARRRFRQFPPHRARLPRPIRRRRRRAGGGPRRPPGVLLASRRIRQACRHATTSPSSTRCSRKRSRSIPTCSSASVKKRLIVTVEVPVIRDDEVLYDISFSPPIEIFQAMVEQQRPSKDWTISIFDGEGTNFARVPNPQETIGKRASPSLYAEMFRQSRSHPADGIARRRAADHELCPLLAHRLDGRRRRRRKLAGRAALAQPRDHKRDGRHSAAGRPRLCGADGDPDRPRRDAPQSPDRGTQPPRQEYARGPAVDRHRRRSAARAGRSARNSREGSARWRRRTIC